MQSFQIVMATITGHSVENSLLMKSNIKNRFFVFFLKRFLKQLRCYLPHKYMGKYITFLLLDFPDSSACKESTCIAGDLFSIPGSGRSVGEGLGYPLYYSWASLVAHLVKNLPAMWKTWVRSLGWQDPLEKGKATHSSILAWRIPWTVQSMRSQRVGHD